jgi:hypothetical protein
MSDDAQKKLRLMTYWLFGSLLIVEAAIPVWTYSVTAPAGADWGLVVANVWPSMVIVLVVAVAIYAVYRYVVLPRSGK